MAAWARKPSLGLAANTLCQPAVKVTAQSQARSAILSNPGGNPVIQRLKSFVQ